MVDVVTVAAAVVSIILAVAVLACTVLIAVAVGGGL